MRQASRDADKWVNNLIESAECEQEREWAGEQLGYKPHDPRLGRGEAAVCLLLFPPTHGRIPKEEWGILHLMDIGHPLRTGVVIDKYMRLLTGSSPTTRAYQCKMRKVASWKTPHKHTELERAQAVTCPCGNGQQDSIHFLECCHINMSKLRQQDVMETANATEDPDWESQVYENSIRKNKQYVNKETFLHRTHLHKTGVEAWTSHDDKDKLLITLGKSGTGINDAVRTALISSCIQVWAKVEDLWMEINGQTTC
jgi:hypothetical protein